MNTNNGKLPTFVAFGEALTDMLRTGADAWKSVPGGAPWNVAQIMASFGVASAFGGAISQDCFGDALWQASAQADLDLRFLQRVPKSPLLAIVHEIQPPSYFFVGDDSADLHFDVAALPQGWETAVRWAHFGGISLARQPLAERLVALAERLSARGVKISYDPNFRNVMGSSYDAILVRMVAIADLVKVSEEDLCGLFRKHGADAALLQLRAMRPTATVLYTRGAQGATLHVADHAWHATPPDISVVDTIGAGDCSLAGFLSSAIQQPLAGWEVHLRAAVAAGAGACLAAGATPPSAQILAGLAEQVQIQSITTPNTAVD
jgi:fructokinase